jgi:hypothetical protein
MHRGERLAPPRIPLPDESGSPLRSFLWLIVILEAHAQINLKKISGLWGHQERMTDYILRRRLLPPDLMRAVWVKWSARERPPELRHDPEAVADEVLFAEVGRLAALSHPDWFGPKGLKEDPPLLQFPEE